MIRSLVLFCVALAFGALCAWPQAEPTDLPEETVKARTEAISKTLRCVICQNQSIADSNSTLAEDMRNLVERRVRLGDSDEDVRAYMQARYGDFVLMKPPVQANTYLLWFGPVVLIALGGVWYAFNVRKRAAGAKADENEDGPLSAQEEARLRHLMTDTEEERRS